MLTKLKLTNFRIFDDEVTVRFRPITILIGRNSSGKSSIIKFLLMLQQSLGPGKSQFLTPEGDRVKLGIFSELKNSLTRKRTLKFELTAKSPITLLDGLSILRDLDLPGPVDLGQLLYKTSAMVSYGKRTRRGRSTHSVVDGISGTNMINFVTDILDDSTFLAQATTLSEGTEWSNDDIVASLTRMSQEHQLLDTLRYQIDSIRHLSPVRDESQRVIIASPPPTDYVGQRGQYALPHLQQMMVEHDERYRFILPHLDRVAGIGDIEFKNSTGYLSQAFAKNNATGAEVLIADYGFGVSQCLPIFVQGALMPPHTSMMVEQPEAQLHPTAQLEMGSFFTDLWRKRKVESIIETHSDNILLRLRRLIAKGNLSHEDVSVAFFTFDQDNRNMPIVKNLDINEDGSMQPGLPMEFFGADVIEGLSLGARA